MPLLKDKDINRIAHQAANAYHGDAPLLEGAIGTMFLAKYFGWKVIYLIHDKRTIKKYEEILGIDFREDFVDEGPRARDSQAFRALDRVSNFWKAVKGEIKGVRSPRIE